VAQKRNTRTTQQNKSLPWGPMLLSFAVGLFVMFLVHLKDNVEPETTQANKTKAKTEKKSNAVEPTFEFYSLLPEMEVMVDTPKSSKRAIVTSPTQANDETSKQTTKEKAVYMLQVGSFRKSSDADAHKAKLAFLGIESKVQTVTIDNKDTWHRVQVGPIIGRDKADKLKKQLQQNDIDSLLVRAKHS
jgi:cell division protein FtsN